MPSAVPARNRSRLARALVLLLFGWAGLGPLSQSAGQDALNPARNQRWLEAKRRLDAAEAAEQTRRVELRRFLEEVKRPIIPEVATVLNRLPGPPKVHAPAEIPPGAWLPRFRTSLGVGLPSPVKTAAFAPDKLSVWLWTRSGDFMQWQFNRQLPANVAGEALPHDVRRALNATQSAFGEDATVRNPFGAFIVRSALRSADGSRKLYFQTGADIELEVVGSRVEKWDTGHSFVAGAALSEDGSRVATASNDEQIKVWEAATRKVLATIKVGSGGACPTPVLNADGTVLVVVAPDGTLTRWEVATGRKTATCAGSQFPLDAVRCLSADGKLAVTSGEREVEVWDLDTGARVGGVNELPDKVQGLVWDPSGTIYCESFNRVEKWDTRGAGRTGRLPQRCAGIAVARARPAGPLLAVGRNPIELVDLATERSVGQIRHPAEGSYYCLAFGPDGSRLAVNQYGRNVSLYDAPSGRPVKVLETNEATVFGLAFNPVGSELAAALADGTVVIWDSQTHETLATLPVSNRPVLAVAYNHDGTLLATGGDDRVVRLWDTKRGRLVAELTGHASEVRDFAFSPDGRLLASAGTGGRLGIASGSLVEPFSLKAEDTRCVLLWDLASRKLLATLEGHNGRVGGLAFDPDGTTLATGGDDRTIHLYDVSVGEPLPPGSGIMGADADPRLDTVPDGGMRRWGVRLSLLVLAGLAAVAFSLAMRRAAAGRGQKIPRQ